MPISFTDRELDVMTVLWRRGPATVAEVRDELSDDLAYTTVLTVLRTLEQKGYLAHEQEGKAHRYRPLVGKKKAAASALQRLLSKVFDGSPELLLTHLVSERDLTAAQLERMKALLDQKLPPEEAP